MKLIKWKTIILRLGNMLNFDNNDYLSKLIDNIEKKKEENSNLAFKITGILDKGFIVKVAGLFAFVSFNHMPWGYSNFGAWHAVYHSIKGKIFFCKIFHISKKPLSIKIDAEVPQFKKPELIEDEKYTGIIINKPNYGVFVDIGYNFKWKCGSLVGLLHRSNFETAELFDKIEIAEEIELYFGGYNEKGQLIFGNKPEIKEWYTGEIDKLIGETVSVNIKKTDDNKINYMAKAKYNATLPINKMLYPETKAKINYAVENLINGDVIHCEIYKINKFKKKLQLKWVLESEIETILSRINPLQDDTPKINNIYNTIQNRLYNEIAQKLNFIGKMVKVEVTKKEDKFGRLQNKYIVEGKCEGKLNISNDIYKISLKEKGLIEQNLQDGEIINCQVLSIEKNLIRVKWNLKDEELFRFMK